jgi:hypothetical protein
MAFEVPTGSPPWTPSIPVSVVRVTVRTTLAREARARRMIMRLGLERPCLAARSSGRRHWNSTTARIVKVTPTGGAANSNVQPACLCSYSATPA